MAIPTAERGEIVNQMRYVDKVHIETTPSKHDTWREVGFRFFQG